jgi:hypothetical protein
MLGADDEPVAVAAEQLRAFEPRGEVGARDRRIVGEPREHRLPQRASRDFVRRVAARCIAARRVAACYVAIVGRAPRGAWGAFRARRRCVGHTTNARRPQGPAGPRLNHVPRGVR